jgi:hypothetical protein
VTSRNLFVVAAAHAATMAGALDMEAATFVKTIGRMSAWYVRDWNLHFEYDYSSEIQ